ncbi:MAG: LapA family protein [Alphaproteobacteria bacterium]|mgnify:FL=1|jgi:uncharacterized integral membrane protein|nr:DUF1049 domain-containing protein [Rhodospirillaceae bacterium]MBT6205315.1 DUF1049 domain-containing protein [Rhodospirillaceae bacterium]MBT6511875.1 DUF1049 domain-containing protein [Rhodospirillaceae bacterium]MBT7612687.1 DUF1049 domain-containing protein [Rhodospirillaceae bacterium]MDG2480909.1 LapA family protein [Alphaproteobacteria bacterium]
MRDPAKMATWFLAGLFALAILVFVLANRDVVPISLSPLPVQDMYLPVWLVVALASAVGAILGGLFVWASAHRSRRISAQRRKQIKALEKELAATQSRSDALESENKNLLAAPAEPDGSSSQDAA